LDSENLFIILGLAFFTLLVYIGFLARRWIHDASDFILAGREVSTGLNIFGIAAIGFAGSSITLIPGFAVLYGFWPTFFNQFIFIVGGLVFYGLFFTPYIRRCGAQTLPEWLEMRFNGNVRLIVTIGTIIGLTGIMANNIVSIGIVISGFIDLPLTVTISVMFFVFLLFSYTGGLWAVTFTDFVQLLLGLIVIPLILLTLFSSFGDFSWVTSRQPEAWFSGSAGTLPIISLRYPSVLTSIILFASFLVWGNNYYWLRCASCRSEKAARDSYIWAGIILALFIYAPLALIGTYSRALFPELLDTASFVEATTAYGLFLREVPLFLTSILLLVPLAAGISTATTAHMGATSVAVRDIYQRRIKPGSDQKQLLLPSKIILLILGLLVWLLCFYPGGPITLFAFANAWLGPPAILILLGILWRRFTPAAAFWSSAVSITIMVVLTFADLTGLFSIDRYMHLGVAGFGSGLVTAVVLTFLTKPHYYGDENWERVPAPGNREIIALIEEDSKVLKLIIHGYSNMTELTDLLGKDAADLSRIIEKLDRGGFIERQALKGAGFYTFRACKQGTAALPEMSSREKALAADRLTEESLGILSVIENNSSGLNSLVEKGNMTSLQLSAILAGLIREGYLAEKGFWRRNIKITSAGKIILSKYTS